MKLLRTTPHSLSTCWGLSKPDLSPNKMFSTQVDQVARRVMGGKSCEYFHGCLWKKRGLRKLVCLLFHPKFFHRRSCRKSSSAFWREPQFGDIQWVLASLFPMEIPGSDDKPQLKKKRLQRETAELKTLSLWSFYASQLSKYQCM